MRYVSFRLTEEQTPNLVLVEILNIVYKIVLTLGISLQFYYDLSCLFFRMLFTFIVLLMIAGLKCGPIIYRTCRVFVLNDKFSAQVYDYFEADIKTYRY